MKQHLENLRAQPDHVKRRIAFLTSLGVTLVIFLFWVVSLSIGTTTVSADAATASNVQSPFASMSASVSDAWGQMKDVFSGSNSSSASANSQNSNGLEAYPTVTK
jgi:hypothetical protein